MTAEERARLRELARKATPGPWEVCAGQLVWDEGTLTCSGCGGVATFDHLLMAEPERPEDAGYIAACSPDAILALLDALDAREKELAALKGEA